MGRGTSTVVGGGGGGGGGASSTGAGGGGGSGAGSAGCSTGCSRVETPETDVGLEVVARHVADRDARRLTRQRLGEGRVDIGPNVLSAGLLYRAGDFVDIDLAAAERRGRNHVESRKYDCLGACACHPNSKKARTERAPTAGCRTHPLPSPNLLLRDCRVARRLAGEMKRAKSRTPARDGKRILSLPVKAHFNYSKSSERRFPNPPGVFPDRRPIRIQALQPFRSRSSSGP